MKRENELFSLSLFFLSKQYNKFSSRLPTVPRARMQEIRSIREREKISIS